MCGAEYYHRWINDNGYRIDKISFNHPSVCLIELSNPSCLTVVCKRGQTSITNLDVAIQYGHGFLNCNTWSILSMSVSPYFQKPVSWFSSFWEEYLCSFTPSVFLNYIIIQSFGTVFYVHSRTFNVVLMEIIPNT